MTEHLYVQYEILPMQPDHSYIGLVNKFGDQVIFR